MSAAGVIFSPLFHQNLMKLLSHGLMKVMSLISLAVLFCFVDVHEAAQAQTLVINEVMSSNGQTLTDTWGEADDWIEILNSGPAPVNLAGMYVSDDLSKRTGCMLSAAWPDSTLLAPGARVLIWADGTPEQDIFHLGFRISQGETLFLYAVHNGAEQVIDQVTLPADLPRDYSLSRIPDGSGAFLITSLPTPGAENQDSGYDPLPPISFSVQGGLYTGPVDLELSCDEAGASIYYTLDGSVPDQLDLLYTRPIRIEDPVDEPNGMSAVRTTVDHSLSAWQEPHGLVKKGRVIRAKAFKGDRESVLSTHTYILDSLGAQRYTVPLVSLVLDSLSFFHPDSGIYHGGNLYDGVDWETANFAQSGDDWERHVHVEYIPFGNRVLAQPAGIRISGSGTRSANQKSLRLYARSDYGDSDFSWPFFTNSDLDAFRRLTIRTSGNDLAHAFMRDPFLHAMLRSKDLELMDSQPVVVFVNGEYWGLHYLRERQDGNYLESHFGIDRDQVDILFGNHEADEGSDTHYVQMTDFIRSHDMSNDLFFSQVDTMMDLENFKQYLAVEFYIANGDWPFNNIKYWRRQTDGYQADQPAGWDGRWRWFLYDTDLGMGRFGNEPFKNTFDKTFTTHGSWQSRLIRHLVGSSELPGNAAYRQAVIAEMAHNMNTVFHPDRMAPAVDAWAAGIRAEIPEQSDRWQSISSLSSWESKVEVLKEFWLHRPGFFRQHMIEQFPDISDTLSLTFDVSDEAHGMVYVNGTRLDPESLERPVSSVLPWTGVYFDQIPVHIRARGRTGYRFVRWDGLDADQAETTFVPDGDMQITAIFEPDPEWGFVQFSEFYFDVPAELGGDALGEFIELYNPGPGSYSLAGHRISEGVGFVFPDTARIASQSYVILARQAETYRHLDVPVYQWTDGKLSNNGEMVTLLNDEEEVADQIYYGYSPPWPVGTDATGYSIEWIQDSTSNDSPYAWQRSYQSGGTPGSGTSQPDLRPKLFINELFAGTNVRYIDEFGETEDWIELFNPHADTVWLDGLYLTDDREDPSGGLLRPFSRDTLCVLPGGFLRFWADDDRRQGLLHLGIKLAKGGERLFLLQGDGRTVMDSVVFGVQDDERSFGRYPDGSESWDQLLVPTPGAPNLPNTVDLPELKINELMAAPYGSWIISGGIDLDWLEIYHAGTSPIDLGGFYLSDDPAYPDKYQISSGDPSRSTVQPGGFSVWYASGQSETGFSHLNLRLNDQGGVVMLSMDTHLGVLTVDSVAYPAAFREVSYGRFPDGADQWDDLIRPSRGFENLDNPYGLGRIYINELASRNKSSWPDSAGVYADWIELHNANAFDVDVGGLFLSDDYADPLKWHIPSGTPDSTTIEAGSFLIFFANGGSPRSVRNPAFMLSGLGGELALTIPQDEHIIFLDSVSFPPLNEGQSWGRESDAANRWIRFGVPSPGQSNGVGTGAGQPVALSGSVRVYPNPSSGVVWIELRGYKPADYMVELLNTRGEVLWSDRQETGRHHPVIRADYPDHLSAGLYYIRLHSDQKPVLLKILIL